MLKLGLTGGPLIVLSPGYFFLSPQKRKDVQAMAFAAMNTLRTVPIISFCIFDYIYTLHGIKYGTEEYFQTQSKLNTRVAQRLLKLFVK